MHVIGITGPTGAGKTTALLQIEALGGMIIDCDQVYHQLLDANRDMQRDLETRFGNLKDPSGVFNRKRLGSLVFGDRQALADLNAITHGYVDVEVRRLLRKARQEGGNLAAIDAIALVESGIARQCTATVAVLAPVEARIARIMARESISHDYAAARIRAQQPDEFYTGHCDYVLYNDGSTQAFAQRARELFLSIVNTPINQS